MELLLIRHALPQRVELESGAADPPLSEAGHAQAQHLADYLTSESLDAVYASPMRRAVQTAQPLAEARSCEIRIVNDVAEWDRNSNEYVPVEELKAANDPRWQAMLNNQWGSAEESPDEFNARVHAAHETLIANHSGHRIAVVCHGGVINSYLARILATETGLAPSQARVRIDQVIADAERARDQAMKAAEQARVFALIGAFVIAASLLVSGAAAYFAAVLGGKHRNENIGFARFGSVQRKRAIR